MPLSKELREILGLLSSAEPQVATKEKKSTRMPASRRLLVDRTISSAARFAHAISNTTATRRYSTSTGFANSSFLESTPWLPSRKRNLSRSLKL